MPLLLISAFPDSVTLLPKPGREGLSDLYFQPLVKSEKALKQNKILKMRHSLAALLRFGHERSAALFLRSTAPRS
jgi:hypothetical protein